MEITEDTPMTMPSHGHAERTFGGAQGLQRSKEFLPVWQGSWMAISRNLKRHNSDPACDARNASDRFPKNSPTPELKNNSSHRHPRLHGCGTDVYVRSASATKNPSEMPAILRLYIA